MRSNFLIPILGKKLSLHPKELVKPKKELLPRLNTKPREKHDVWTLFKISKILSKEFNITSELDICFLKECLHSSQVTSFNSPSPRENAILQGHPNHAWPMLAGKKGTSAVVGRQRYIVRDTGHI